MKKLLFIISFTILSGCTEKHPPNNQTSNPDNRVMFAEDILGNPNYPAISYGGYRHTSREIQPTIEELKDDVKILFAMGIRVLRTYNTHFAQAGNLLEAIRQLKNENPNFEMYVMLGAWINCENAFTSTPNHEGEDAVENLAEIKRAVELTNEYADIVKIIAVGNEAMVKWAASYFVQPWVILKWVNYLQELKSKHQLPSSTWITSSDNFASWGGGDGEYHIEDLEKLVAAVDYISMHTYPMHDTHYNPQFWGIRESESTSSSEEQIKAAMLRAKNYAQSQYQSVAGYVESLGLKKSIHIGETGWATSSNGLYGQNGSRATDEYKEALYYRHMRKWTNESGISCFYFEAFDEVWKDAQNPGGSENYFGLFTLDGQAKYALWDMVDQDIFEGLTRNGKIITKTYGGRLDKLKKEVFSPPHKKEVAKH